ncbi:hypothetical protein BKA01_001563 [Pseudonocardia eucalypti]|nr:hypothetical protein [Pseudonocardia eucalypti]
MVRAAGPFATVYLDGSHQDPGATQAIELAWRDARAGLRSDGADEATLGALDDVVASIARAERRDPGWTGWLLVAAEGTVRLCRALPHAPDPPRARWAMVPDVLPALIELPEPVELVLAVVDAQGAEISVGQHVRQLDTGRHPLHPVHGGGLAHLPMRRRVEENQRASARRVAHALEAEVSNVGGDLLVLAGETQSRSRVYRELTGRARAVVEQAEHGGRAPGSDDDALAEEVARLVDGRIADERRTAFERWQRHAGGHEHMAVEGLQPVFDAFQAGLVDALYLDPSALAGREAWIGAEPGQVSAVPEPLLELGLCASGPVPSADALVRAAAGTGSTLHLLDEEGADLVERRPVDGVGAILRAETAGGTG